MPRLRANSLTIYISAAHKWRAPRPPTPRRQTFPGANNSTSSGLIHNIASTNNTEDTDIPSIPPLSYFEPDTPNESMTSLILVSPRDSLFSGFSAVSPGNNLFSGFSPASPSVYSPMSPNVFSYSYQYSGSSLSPQYTHQYPASPLSSIHLFSCIPSCEPSPMSPRFLFPRTPPLPPQPLTQFHRTLVQNEDSTSPTHHCFSTGHERKYSTPYTRSPLVLCRSTVTSNASSGENTTLKTILEDKSPPRKLGWSDIDSPVRLYFRAMGADKGRKKALRQRRFKVVKEGERMSVGVGMV